MYFGICIHLGLYTDLSSAYTLVHACKHACMLICVYVLATLYLCRHNIYRPMLYGKCVYVTKVLPKLAYMQVIMCKDVPRKTFRGFGISGLH